MLPAGVDLEKLAALRDKVDWQRLAIEEEEDEEDTVGPAAPGKETIGYIRATAAAEARLYNEMMSKMEEEEQAKAPKHEEWFDNDPHTRVLALYIDIASLCHARAIMPHVSSAAAMFGDERVRIREWIGGAG